MHTDWSYYNYVQRDWRTLTFGDNDYVSILLEYMHKAYITIMDLYIKIENEIELLNELEDYELDGGYHLV